MDKQRMPKPGEFYKHFKDKLYQIVAIAAHTETGEAMVVYQALYGDFKTYVRPLEMFLSEVDKVKYPEVTQQYRFERILLVDTSQEVKTEVKEADDRFQEVKVQEMNSVKPTEMQNTTPSVETVNSLLLDFLDAGSYNRKLEVLTSNMKHLTDRLINDMAVSLDCSVDEGPLEERIQKLIYSLQTMSRFEDRRLR